MRLPHHSEAIQALRTPSVESPWRVLLSGCLAGLPCGVDGTDYGLGAARPRWLSENRVHCLSFCPEDHGMGTPRTMPDLHGGDGFAVLDGTARVLDEHRVDLTAAMLAGARAMLNLAVEHEVDLAVLTDRSGACGSQVISIGCRYEEPVQHRRGVGVAAALLIRHGIPVVSQRDPRTLGLLGARLDPAYAPGPEVVDHHLSPWVLENLPLKDDMK
ncbi:MAG: 2-thiouracil desulfurase family protein [Myxococcota bacterium]|nr:2-thiouracil desulfurase family protein [Myxococcota bacterium]